MPIKRVPFGPISALYVGDASSEDALTRMLEKRTKGTFLQAEPILQYVACRKSYIQADLDTLSFSLTFMAESDNVIKIARGLPLSETDIDAPSTNAKYTILVIGPEPLSKRNYLFLSCQNTAPFTDNFEKLQVVNKPIIFQCADRDRNNRLFYRRTTADLKTILGDRSPF